MRSTPAIDAELAARLREAVDRFDDGSADAFGRRIGYVNGGYIREVFKGVKPVREALIDRVHRVPELSGWFDDVLPESQADDNDAFAAIRHAGVKLSAGDGYVVGYEKDRSPLSFRKDYLRSIGVSPKRAVVVHVTGRSMEPMIPDGAVLLINQAAQVVARDGLVYAFRVDDSLLVKKLYRRDDSLLAVSENPDREQFPDRVIGPSADFNMIGRVVWMGASL